jgi:hypothetical protein
LTVLNKLKSTESYKFYIRASTIGQVSAVKEVNLVFSAFDNGAPKFAEPLEDMSIDINEANVDDLKVLEYTSPKISDKENDKVIIKTFGSFTQAPCKCITVS